MSLPGTTSRYGIIQSGVFPYRMVCTACEQTWLPEPVRFGQTKGQHTDHSLDKSAEEHWRRCRGRG